jgi:hypothetical protein
VIGAVDGQCRASRQSRSPQQEQQFSQNPHTVAPANSQQYAKDHTLRLIVRTADS